MGGPELLTEGGSRPEYQGGMAMLRSMYSAYGGLQAHQQRMDAVGNNVANVNTIGYKRNRVTFKDLLYQNILQASGPDLQRGRGGINPHQLGLGVTVAGTDTIHTQGSLQSTGISTDLAIEGSGFFALHSAGNRYYTRAGNFTIDGRGYLVNGDGMYVQGWTAKNGKLPAPEGGTEGAIPIPFEKGMPGEATENVNYRGNLNTEMGLPAELIGISEGENLDDIEAGDTIEIEYTDAEGELQSITVEFDGTESTLQDIVDAINEAADDDIAFIENDVLVLRSVNMGDEAKVEITALNLSGDADIGLEEGSSATGEGRRSTTLDVFDEQGRQHRLNVIFNKIDYNEWSVEVTPGAGAPFDADDITFPEPHVITFNEDGTFGSGDSATLEINLEGINTSDLEIELDFSSLTQYAAETDIRRETDGNPPGGLESFSIDNEGIMLGRYTNGQTRELAQIAIANFSNPGGLTKEGGNLFMETANSGSAEIGAPQTGGRGAIASGTIEMSNVDLAEEFTDMITTQRGYQANSRTISAADEMLQDVVNLRR